MRKVFLSLSAFLYACSLQAQTLVHIGPAEISVPEFLWVYNKSNIETARNKKNIRQYLDLYIP